MTVETHLPDEELRSRVESILIVHSDEGMINPLPPNPAPVLAFRIQGITAEQLSDGERVVPRIGITGLNLSPRVMHFHQRSAVLLVRFHAGGAAGLITTPMDELTGTSRGLDFLMEPGLAHEIEDRLDEVPDSAGRIAVIQGFLKARLPGPPPDPLIVEAIRIIRRSRGKTVIGELVRHLATNADTLEKRFRQIVGTTPKTFSRIVRFQSFVAGYSARADLTEAALQAGFYDHAHLVRESRTFTGLSPRDLLNRPRRW